MTNDIKQFTQEHLGKLTPREAKVVRLHYGLEGRGHTVEEIASLLDESPETIREPLP